MNREEELAKGLAQLQREMSHMMRHVASIQSLVPVIDFGSFVDSADEADERELAGRMAAPPALTAETLHQLPMFDPPITIIFENITINGETINPEETE